MLLAENAELVLLLLKERTTKLCPDMNSRVDETRPQDYGVKSEIVLFFTTSCRQPWQDFYFPDTLLLCSNKLGSGVVQDCSTYKYCL